MRNPAKEKVLENELISTAKSFASLICRMLGAIKPAIGAGTALAGAPFKAGSKLARGVTKEAAGTKLGKWADNDGRKETKRGWVAKYIATGLTAKKGKSNH